MRAVLIVLFFSSVAFAGCSNKKNVSNIKSNIFILDSIYEIPLINEVIKERIEISDKYICADGDNLWVYLPNLSDSLILINFNILSRKFNLYCFDMTHIKLPFSINNPEIQNISIKKDKIAILFFEGYAIFDKKDNFIHLLKAETLPNPYQSIKINDNYLFLYRCYNYTGRDTNFKKTEIQKIDINSNKKEILPLHFDVIEFSHIAPNKWIDISNELIAFSNTTKYKIDIFNKDFNKINEISRIPKNWIDIPVKELNFGYELGKVKSIFPKLMLIDSSDGSRIQNICFLSDSILLVSYSPGKSDLKNKKIFCYDLWEYSDNKWQELSFDNIEFLRLDNSETVSKENYPYSGVYNLPIYLNGSIVLKVRNAPPHICFKEEVSYIDLNKNIGNFFKINDYKFNLEIFRISR